MAVVRKFSATGTGFLLSSVGDGAIFLRSVDMANCVQPLVVSVDIRSQTCQEKFFFRSPFDHVA
jgi:hypothetical protein